MSEWSNVLDSILDSIPVVSAPASPVKPPPGKSSKVDNPAYDAPVTADMLREAGLATDPAPIAEPTEPAPLQPNQLAYYQQFVGKIVSDAQMTDLYMAAHRNGFRLTSEAQGRWWEECDYKVTGCHG